MFLAAEAAGGGSARGRSKKKKRKGEAVGRERGSYDDGPMLLGSQPKSRTGLMGSPLLCDPILKNWSRHPNSCLPSCAYCNGDWPVDGDFGVR